MIPQVCGDSSVPGEVTPSGPKGSDEETRFSTQFDVLGLKNPILQWLRALDFKAPIGEQSSIIAAISSKRDSIVQVSLALLSTFF